MSKIYVDTTTGEVLENVVELNTSANNRFERTNLNSAPYKRPSAPRGRMIEITCAAPGCSNKKQVRAADVARGWGKYCSKSCAKK